MHGCILLRYLSSPHLSEQLEKALLKMLSISSCRRHHQMRRQYCKTLMHLSILGPTTPHTGCRWGLVGIIRDLHVNFDPRGGAFDQFAVKKYVLEWSWQSLGEPERSRVVTFIGGRKELKYFQTFLMSSEGRKFTQSVIFESS